MPSEISCGDKEAEDTLSIQVSNVRRSGQLNSWASWPNVNGPQDNGLLSLQLICTVVCIQCGREAHLLNKQLRTATDGQDWTHLYQSESTDAKRERLFMANTSSTAQIKYIMYK